MKAANLDPSAVDSVCVGNVLSCAGVDTPYVARHSLLRLGIGVDKPANTVNRLCGSGFQVGILSSGLAHDVICFDSFLDQKMLER